MGPHRGTTVLAWSLFVLWAGLAIATEVVGSSQSANRDHSFPLMLVGYAAVGAVVAWRHPGNAVGWLLVGIALTITLQIAGETYVIPLSHPGHVAVAWVSGLLFTVWFLLIVAFLPLVFPTGRLLSSRWRPVWWFDVLTLLASVAAVGLTPGEMAVNAPGDNPLGVDGTALVVLEWLEPLVLAANVAAVVLSGVSLALRFHRSIGVERQQLKWFASAVLLALGSLIVSTLGDLLPNPWGEALNSLGWAGFLFSCILGIPVATGIAVLRYRLYDIDLVINRTLVYGSLTAALATTYVGSILLLRLGLSPVAGHSDLAVAGSTLMVAALFRPARARIQAVVDRRFYRRRYDAVSTLDEFSGRLRDELDLDAVGADLCAIADRSVQPAHVSLWLREPVIAARAAGSAGSSRRPGNRGGRDDVRWA
jgi:hypothetical protein